jgi:hypothetical protein
MKTNWILSVTIVAMAVSVAAGAQSGKGMEKPKEDKMNATYTGCVQDFNHGAAFLLTDVDDAGTKAAHDGMSMKHDDMGMKSDAATMKKEQTRIVLTGASDLKKHVGQKVSVTGSLSSDSMGTMHEDRWTLAVKTLKVLAKSCS